jgi:hypothetical protein
LDTALHPSLNAGDRAAEIFQAATDERLADITEDLATDVSLWDRAYDALENEEPNRIATYEDLLSRVLIRGRPSP